MNRRQFIQSSVALAVIASLPAFEADVPAINAAYPPGDIRRYGANQYVDCTEAFQAAVDDKTPRDIGIYVPPGEWQINGHVTGILRGHKIGIKYAAV